MTQPAAGPRETLLHASCVAMDGRGLLILGPSGSGKSGLALQLIALGARLVADDQTLIRRDSDATLTALCPAAVLGLIEARGLGILRAPSLAKAQLVLAVDLGQTETERLPSRRRITFLGAELDLVLGNQTHHFPAAVLCYLRHGRHG